MNIPALPTDNLYKFMALSGIVLIVFSFLLPWRAANRSQELLRDVKANLRIIDTLPLSSDERAKLLGNSVKNLEELKLIIEKDKPFYMIAFIIGETFGIVLCISGFTLWYKRVQKYNDQILIQQAKEFKKNSKTDIQES